MAKCFAFIFVLLGLGEITASRLSALKVEEHQLSARDLAKQEADEQQLRNAKILSVHDGLPAQDPSDLDVADDFPNVEHRLQPDHSKFVQKYLKKESSPKPDRKEENERSSELESYHSGLIQKLTHTVDSPKDKKLSPEHTKHSAQQQHMRTKQSSQDKSWYPARSVHDEHSSLVEHSEQRSENRAVSQDKSRHPARFVHDGHFSLMEHSDQRSENRYTSSVQNVGLSQAMEKRTKMEKDEEHLREWEDMAMTEESHAIVDQESSNGQSFDLPYQRVGENQETNFLAYFKPQPANQREECAQLGPGTKSFCLCNTQRQEGFMCEFDCTCTDGVCEASICHVTGAFVTVFSGTMLLLAAVAFFYFTYKRQQVISMKHNMRFYNERLKEKQSNQEDIVTAISKLASKNKSLPVPAHFRSAKQGKVNSQQDLEAATAIKRSKVSQNTSVEPPIAAATNTMKVGIVGGGMACLATAHEFLKRNYDVTMIDSSDGIKGTWARAFHRQLATPMKYFVDWRLPNTFPKQTSEDVVRAFLDNYVDEMSLRSKIRFNTTVTKIIKRVKGGFSVHTSTKDGHEDVCVYDLIIMSTGMFTNPLVIDLNVPRQASNANKAKVLNASVNRKNVPPTNSLSKQRLASIREEKDDFLNIL